MHPFVHLHVHSQYSILDGQASVSDLVKKARKDGMRGIALTDHGAMFGIKQFFDECNNINASVRDTIKSLKKEEKALLEKSERTPKEETALHNIREQIVVAEQSLFKPILGCEAYCAHRTRHDKDKDVPDPYHPGRSTDRSGWHLILLAKNRTGYQNLCKMVSLSYTEGEYYRPRIDKELLEKYHEGVIALSACLGGEVPQHIMAGYPDRAEETVRWFKSIFGEDYYLEVQLHKTEDPNANRDIYVRQLAVNEVIYDIAERVGVKVVATNDVHFTNQEDAAAHDMLICIGTKKDLNDPTRMRYSQQEWLKTQAEMNEIFRNRPEVLSNTLEVLDKVEFYSIENKPLMPDFPLPEGFADADEYLAYLSYEGAKKRYGEPLSEEVIERIDFELGVIKNMGFPGYFLIVQDYIQKARDMGVIVGPGRGSAAGSAVAYCLKITNLDPLKYGLLFERFLNPDRKSLPDIDVDFDEAGRAKILQWVTEKYGKEKVAHIITMGEMAAKSSIADVARMEHLSLAESNQIKKLIPEKFNDSDLERLKKIPGFEEAKNKVTIDAAMALVPELKKYQVSSDPLVRETIKYARQLEGNIRNTGVHACGVIISNHDISDVVPISTGIDNKTGEKVLVTQYEGSVIESTGLIKMDFLGLKTLNIISETLENIRHHHKMDLDIDTIPLDDQPTFDLFCAGNTVGIFQFESAGMQKYLRELKPDRFELLIAMNALYRPGPMEYIPQYIARRHGREDVVYEIPEAKEYLEETYGVTVYQEQVMLLSRLLAGFTRGESDSLRKAMGKKKKAEMDKLKAKFLKGGEEHGHPIAILEKTWSDWEAFAKYAFNKSHAACYSWVAYQTAYLKANYPSEFMAGNLSCNLNNATEIAKLMEECKAMGIPLLSPDINESMSKFSVNANGDIRFGLSGIKGVSKATVEAVLQERKERGDFSSIFDFMARLPNSAINKKNMEAFVLSGALDSLGVPREAYFAPPVTGINSREENFISTLLLYNKKVQEESQSPTINLFGDTEELQLPTPEIPDAEPWGDLERLSKEHELVGFYISSNPLDSYSIIIDKYCNTQLDSLQRLDELIGRNLIFAGLVTQVSTGITKKNQPYGRFVLEDYSGSYEFAIFGKRYMEYEILLKKSSFLLCHATVQHRPYKEDELEVSFDNIQFLPDIASTLIKKVEIDIPYQSIDNNFVADLKALLEENSDQAKGSQCAMIFNLLDKNNYSVGQYQMGAYPFLPEHWVTKLLERYELSYRVQ